jgi:hypothetical protein
MALPKMTADRSLEPLVPSGEPVDRRTAPGLVPALTLTENQLQTLGFNCAAAGGGHGGYACFSAAGYPHLSITGATRQAVNTGNTIRYDYTFTEIHYSPNAGTSIWYDEFAPGRWDPRANNTSYPAEAMIQRMGGSVYGYGARGLAAQGPVVYG